MILGNNPLRLTFLMEASEDFKNQCMVVLDERDTKYENFFSELKKVNLDRFALALTFDNALAYYIPAGSDILLIPSQFTNPADSMISYNSLMA